MAGGETKVDDATLRRMCHLVTHDLRNPLAAIVTNLEFAVRILEEGDVDPDLAEAVQDSVTACDVLRRIVSNFDLVAKGDAMPTAQSNLVLEQVVQDVVRRCQARADQAELQIVVKAEGTTKVKSDRTMLALALENLLSNSIQHGPSRSQIDVVVSAESDRAVVTIHDRGLVLEGEDDALAMSVEAHTMEGRKPNSRYGRGLGLLCAQLAAQMAGAEVGLSSADGVNRFRLSLVTS